MDGEEGLIRVGVPLQRVNASSPGEKKRRGEKRTLVVLDCFGEHWAAFIFSLGYAWVSLAGWREYGFSTFFTPTQMEVEMGAMLCINYVSCVEFRSVDFMFGLYILYTEGWGGEYVYRAVAMLGAVKYLEL